MTRRLPPTLSVDTTALTTRGFSMARTLEHDVLVKGALPGESVVTRLVGRRKGQVMSVCENVEKSSPERVDVICPYFLRCGGCALQHQSYRAQVKFKMKLVSEALASFGIQPNRIADPVTGPLFGYRRRARLGVRRLHSSGEVLLGFRETFGSRVVRMDACQVLAKPFDMLVLPLKELITELSIADAIPQVEIVCGDDKAGILVRHLRAFSSRDLFHLRDFSRRHSLRVFSQSGGYDTVRLVAPTNGGHSFTYRNDDFGLCFEFGMTDFVQINASINTKLVRSAILGLEIDADEHVVDLFCGIGNFSLAAARVGARVTGIENEESAVDRARQNAEKNGLSGKAKFIQRDLYHSDEGLNAIDCDKLLLDPPRLGAEVALRGWVGKSVRQIAYISCNPRTFARDADWLLKLGFECESICIFDMFPHTSHIEMLGNFHR